MEKVVLLEPNQVTKRKFKLKMPHSYVFMGLIILITAIFTYIIPAGEFDRVEDPVTKRSLVVPGSYHSVHQTPVSFFNMFISIQKGMLHGAEIIFYLFFAYGFIFILTKTGVFNSGIGALVRKMKGKESLIIPVFMLVFGAMGAGFGMYEESYGYIPIMMGITVALGYDALVGVAIVYVSITTGFAAAVTNPFTVGIAQGIAGIPLFSGIAFRAIAFVVFMSISIFFVMRYAKMVKENPEKSIVKNVQFPFLSGIVQGGLTDTKFTLPHKVSLGLFVCTIITLVTGTVKFGWYLPELSGVFIIMMIAIGLVNKLTLAEVADTFIEACRNMVYAALLIGMANAILVILEDGNIIDTVVHYMAYLIQDLSPYAASAGMIILQTLLNFFVPSGSAAATISMPIMTPLSELIGINRQIAVLAFSFGDGFANMLWPSTVVVICGIAGIPVDRWYKFLWPLFITIISTEIIFIIIAVAINYGP
ncbi:YfcC family protein [Bacillus sp. UNC438CL73TsuS30]|uniref:YfcC family protein n=1 Tax=Bacillus sp. UNC438CL73TsuS30 TaxID=1340434 RepID=UPI0006904405|nr:AbgT family transporter [Bacillus sp. UNC438CL73TsuS30]